MRHQTFLLRRGAGLANEVIPEVERLIEQVAARIINTPDQRARQRAMITELRSFLGAAYSVVQDQVFQGALDLAHYESEYQPRLLSSVATVEFAAPALAQITASIENDLLDVQPGRQMTIRQALADYGDKKTRQIIQTVNDGITTQQTNAQIAQAVQALTKLHVNQADALVRTMANAAADFAKREANRSNADILEGERWTSTLDIKTTPLCQSRDGQVYPIDQGPRTPAHWQCRSIRVAIVRRDLQIPGFEGERPAVGSDGPELVSSRMTYTGFLKRQSKEFQNEALGVEKAKLFRAGKVTLSDLVNPFGEPMTLAELRARGV